MFKSIELGESSNQARSNDHGSHDHHNESFDINKMAKEILEVIQKRFPEEQASLQAISCEGNLARCIYSINERTVFEIKL